jgi:hypothetical protein
MSRRPATLLAIALAAGCEDRARDAGACVDGDVTQATDLCNQCDCEDGEWGVTQRLCTQGLYEGANCYGFGIGDVDPVAAGVQVACNFLVRVARPGGGFDESVGPACVRTSDGFALPASDVDACWYARTDTTHTGDAIDDVSEGCIAARGEAEIVVLRRPDSLATEFSAHCSAPDPLCPGPPIDAET